MKENKIIIVIVNGGVISFEHIPPGIEIKVVDYDIEGYDESRIEMDDEGDKCVITEYVG